MRIVKRFPRAEAVFPGSIHILTNHNTPDHQREWWRTTIIRFKDYKMKYQSEIVRNTFTGVEEVLLSYSLSWIYLIHPVAQFFSPSLSVVFPQIVLYLYLQRTKAAMPFHSILRLTHHRRGRISICDESYLHVDSKEWIKDYWCCPKYLLWLWQKWRINRTGNWGALV